MTEEPILPSMIPNDFEQQENRQAATDFPQPPKPKNTDKNSKNVNDLPIIRRSGRVIKPVLWYGFET